MTTLSRYLIKEHLGPFALALLLIVFVLVIDLVLQTMDQVLSKGLSLGLAARLFLYNLAWIIALAVPMDVLVSVLMAFARPGRRQRNHGCQGLRGRFPAPAASRPWAAAVLTVLMVLFNDWVLPDWNYRRAYRLQSETSQGRRRTEGKKGVFIHKLGNRYSLHIRQVDERNNYPERHNPLRQESPRSAHHPAPAAAGRIQIFGDGSYIRLTLYDGEFHRVEGGDHTRFWSVGSSGVRWSTFRTIKGPSVSAARLTGANGK